MTTKLTLGLHSGRSLMITEFFNLVTDRSKTVDRSNIESDCNSIIISTVFPVTLLILGWATPLLWKNVLASFRVNLVPS